MRRSKAVLPWPVGPLATVGGCNDSLRAVGAMATALWGLYRQRKGMVLPAPEAVAAAQEMHSALPQTPVQPQAVGREAELE